jgi:hypothetical protein
MAGELVTRLFENLVEAVACVLQTALQRSGTDVELARDIVDFGPAAGELPLDGGAHTLGESLLPLVLLQFFIKLRGEHG